MIYSLDRVISLRSLVFRERAQRWLKLLLSISRGAFSEGIEMLEENRRTLSSRGVIEEATEAEVKAGPRGDKRRDKLLLLENDVKIPLRRNVNVSE